MRTPARIIIIIILILSLLAPLGASVAGAQALPDLVVSVRDLAERPLPGVTVTVRDGPRPPVTSVTDAQGVAALSPVSGPVVRVALAGTIQGVPMTHTGDAADGGMQVVMASLPDAVAFVVDPLGSVAPDPSMFALESVIGTPFPTAQVGAAVLSPDGPGGLRDDAPTAEAIALGPGATHAAADAPAPAGAVSSWMEIVRAGAAIIVLCFLGGLVLLHERRRAC